MRLSALSVFVTLACISLAAPAFAIDAPQLKAIGWTADDAAFIYAAVVDEDSTPDEWFVVSSPDGKTTSISDRKKMEAFLRQHPMPGYKLDGASPDDSDAPAIPGNPQATSDLKDGEDYRAGAVIHCSVKRGDAVLPSATIKLKLSGRPGLDARFSRDGKRVAWLLTQQACSPTGQGDFNCTDDEQVALDRAVGPRLQLLGKDLPPTALPNTTSELERGGFVVAAIGEAQKPRDRTVVYAAKGSEAEARKVAAAIPGGATVEALSWKAPFELVIAVGSSAAR